MQILLIDDDEDDREFFAIAVEECDLSIDLIAAPGCSEALSLLATGKTEPDFIFLDLNMPRIDGRECLSILKADPKLSRFPVVIYTTSSDSRDMEQTKRLGAIDFITKDSKITQLTVTLTRFFNHHLQNSMKD